MTNGSDWITEMRALLKETALLTQSNAKSIQALTDDIAAFKLTVEQDREEAKAERRQADAERQELRQAMIGVANLLSSLDSDRPTILRKLNTIENKVDQLLSRENGDQPQ